MAPSRTARRGGGFAGAFGMLKADPMVWTLPNILTFARILAVPVLVAMLGVAGDAMAIAAAVLFVTASLTDYLDGWLARRMKLTSHLGTMLDPIADKLLVAAALMMLVANGAIPGAGVVAAVVILVREVFISGLREFLAGLNATGLPVSRLAKWKTASQMAAIALLILSGWSGLWPPLVLVGHGLLIVAAVLTVITGWQYARAGIGRIVAADRARQGTGAAGDGRPS